MADEFDPQEFAASKSDSSGFDPSEFHDYKQKPPSSSMTAAESAIQGAYSGRDVKSGLPEDIIAEDIHLPLGRGDVRVLVGGGIADFEST